MKWLPIVLCVACTSHPATPSGPATPEREPTQPTAMSKPDGGTQVYIDVRAVGSETTTRTRVLRRQDIRVEGASWSCVYLDPIDASPVEGDPLSIGYNERIHIVQCSHGGLGSGISLSCPANRRDLVKALNGMPRLANVLALSEESGAGDLRFVISINCEL